MKNKQISDYDQTKRMLNTLRKLNEEQSNKKSLIEGYEIPDNLKSDKNFDLAQNGDSSSEDNQNTEDNSTPQDEATQNMENNVTVINDVDVKLQSSDEIDMQLGEEQKTAISEIIDTFRQQVSQIATFDPGFSITPTQIRFDGELSDFDLHFTVVAGEDQGLYLSSEMSQLSPEFLDIITKMGRFDQMFRDAMEPLITQRQNN